MVYSNDACSSGLICSRTTPKRTNASLTGGTCSYIQACYGMLLSPTPLHTCRQQPNKPASMDTLRELGVLSWTLDADSFESDPKLQAIRKARNYSYQVGQQADHMAAGMQCSG